ncbi:MAG: hypothetical protein QOF74_3682 [Caballeronia mineralivorans]|nr:hypothetical protein [Caballeronia mineralivorans]
MFVWGEQGFGDALQFARFVPEIARRVQERGKLIYCAFAPLFELFERSLSEHEVDVVPHDTARLPDFDFHIPVGSLPLALGVTLDNLPAPSSYVVTDARRTAYWREKLQGGSGLKVGLVWSGSRTHQRNPLRSVPPALYARAFGSLSGVEFYSLQVDGADEVAAMASDGLEVIDCTKELKSFDESAALLQSRSGHYCVHIGCSSVGRTRCAYVATARRQPALGVDARARRQSMVSVDADLSAATIRRLAASARTGQGRAHGDELIVKLA